MAFIETELAKLYAGIEKLKGKQGENARAEAKKVRQRDRHLGSLKQMEEDEMGCGCGWAGASQGMAKGEDFDQNLTIIDAELKVSRNSATIKKAYRNSQGCAKDEC